jgi:hemoglobin
VIADPRLNANPPVNEAHDRASAAGFKYFVTELLCSAAVAPKRIPVGRWGTRTGIS